MNLRAYFGRESGMEVQEAYRQKMSAQLNEWSAQINLLDAKVENAAADLKVQRAEALRDLRSKQHVASEKLRELGKSSGAAWEQVRETADKIWEDLRTGLAEAHSKFK